MGPLEAVPAHKDLNARISIASHYQVFQLGPDDFDDAVNGLSAVLKEHNLDHTAFVTSEPGQPLDVVPHYAEIRDVTNIKSSGTQ